MANSHLPKISQPARLARPLQPDERRVADERERVWSCLHRDQIGPVHHGGQASAHCLRHSWAACRPGGHAWERVRGRGPHDPGRDTQSIPSHVIGKHLQAGFARVRSWQEYGLNVSGGAYANQVDGIHCVLHGNAGRLRKAGEHARSELCGSDRIDRYDRREAGRRRTLQGQRHLARPRRRRRTRLHLRGRCGHRRLCQCPPVPDTGPDATQRRGPHGRNGQLFQI